MNEELKVIISAEIDKLRKDLDAGRKQLQNFEKQGTNMGQKLGKAMGTMGKATATAFKAVGAAAVAGVAAMVGLSEATADYAKGQAKLKSAFQSVGSTVEQATETYNDLYRVLGDSDVAVEAAGHLAKLTTNQEDLAEWSNICQGVYATFGDSIPIESLTEAANETAKTGEITGALADALNWAGVNEDEFADKLFWCNTEAEREALIRETLTGLYGDAAAAYEENAASLLAANEAQAALTASLAALGDTVRPIVTIFKEELATTLQDLVPHLGLVAEGMKAIMDGDASGAEKMAEGIANVLNTLVNKITELLPTILTVGIQIITALIEGIITAFPNIINAVIGVLPLLVEALVKVIPQLTNAVLSMLPMLLEAAVSLVLNVVSGVTEMLPLLLEQIVKFLPQVITTILNSLPMILEAALSLVMSLIEMLPSFLVQIIGIIPELLTKLLGDILPQLIVSLISTIMELIPALLLGVLDIVLAIVAALPKILTALVKAIPNLITIIIFGLMEALPQILEGVIELVVGIVDALPQIITAIVEAIPSLIGGILVAVLECLPQIIAALIKLVARLVVAIPEILLSLVKAIANIFLGIWNTATNIFNNAPAWFKENFTKVFNSIKSALGGLGDYFSGLWDKIKKIFGNVGSTIGNAITSTVKTAVNGVLSTATKIINGFISAINSAISVINAIPGVNIGKLNSLSVPKLARGGIIDTATIAMVGESGKEAVVPLENNTEWLDMLTNRLVSAIGGSNKPIYLQIDKKTFGQISAESINDITIQSGRIPLILA